MAVNVELVVAIEIVEELVRALARIFHFDPELANAPAAYDDFLGLFLWRSGAALLRRRLGLREGETTDRVH
jgi:hypothetical protein